MQNKSLISLCILAIASLITYSCGDSTSPGQEESSSSQLSSSTTLSSGEAPSSSSGISSGTSSIAMSSSIGFSRGEPLAIGGYSYPTVNIGSQTWMAENMKVVPASDSSWCYNDATSNCDTYGRLYRYETAMTLCPAGWHLPDTTEWQTLVAAVGSTKKLKTSTLWTSIGKGTDDYSFSAVPGGYSYNGSSEYMGEEAYFWTSTESDEYNAWFVKIGGFTSTLFSMSFGKDFAYSVRCVHD